MNCYALQMIENSAFIAILNVRVVIHPICGQVLVGWQPQCTNVSAKVNSVQAIRNCTREFHEEILLNHWIIRWKCRSFWPKIQLWSCHHSMRSFASQWLGYCIHVANNNTEYYPFMTLHFCLQRKFSKIIKFEFRLWHLPHYSNKCLNWTERKLYFGFRWITLSFIMRLKNIYVITIVYAS